MKNRPTLDDSANTRRLLDILDKLSLNWAFFLWSIWEKEDSRGITSLDKEAPFVDKGGKGRKEMKNKELESTKKKKKNRNKTEFSLTLPRDHGHRFLNERENQGKKPKKDKRRVLLWLGYGISLVILHQAWNFIWGFLFFMSTTKIFICWDVFFFL